jgi:hypothetical protein
MSDSKSVRISAEILDRIDSLVDSEGAKSRGEIVEKLIDRAIRMKDLELQLDTKRKSQYFKHLTGGKGKEYQVDLMTLELTEQELIEMALEKSGKSYTDLLKEGLISASKEAITRSARNEYLNQSALENPGLLGTPERRLQVALAELTEMAFQGRYRPRGGKMNISAVAARAHVNPNTAKEWARQNQPDLL